MNQRLNYTLTLKLLRCLKRINETEDVPSKVKKSRNRYINEGVDYYNRLIKRNFISTKLAGESELVTHRDYQYETLFSGPDQGQRS